MQGARAWSLVGELRSHMQRGMVKTKKKGKKAKDLKRNFSKEDIAVTKKHVKTCSTSFISKALWTENSQMPHAGWLLTNEEDNSWVRMWRKRNPCALLVGMRTARSLRKSLAVPQRAKYRIIVSSAIPLLVPLYPKEVTGVTWRATRTLMVTACKRYNPRVHPQRRGQMNVVWTHDGPSLSHKRGEPWMRGAQREKPDVKGQIL